MAVIVGAKATYGYNVASGNNDAQNESIDISSYLDVLHPTDVPLLKLIGRDSLRDGCQQIKHEWLEDAVRGLSTSTTDADIVGATTTPARVTITSGDGTKFRGSGNGANPAVYGIGGPADIVRISSPAGEELAVVSQQVDANTIDVNRGFFSGSAAVSHTGTATITIVGTFQVQGLTTVGAARTTTKANKFNYTQIFQFSITASTTQQVTKKFTMQNDVQYQTENELEVIGENMERTLLFGRKQAPSATAAQSMDGIRAFISTNATDKAGAALTQAAMEDQLQAIWQAGARAKVIVTNATQKRRINSFLDAYKQTDYANTLLGTTVERYHTNFGDVDVLLDRHMPDNEILFLDTTRIGFGPLRPLGISPIAPTSRESQTWEATGEYTAEVRQESAHARTFNLATTGLF